MHHRTYQAQFHGKFPGLNYVHQKPFRNWKSAHLETLIRGWLKQNPPCLELATLALGELTQRGEDLNASMSFAAAKLEPIPWLETARMRVQRIFEPDDRPEMKSAKRKGNIYVILRGGYTSENAWYGAYVGSTKKPVKTRYMEHRKGPRAAKGLPKHGIEPLFSLFDFLNPVPAERQILMEWETRLHEALAPVIPKVTGDVAF